ncbi:unnamed protein product [Rotaria sordida]|uniref:Uncharacterized protein n=1 Tax=Rotaria sordida TaxID=392033 RepID=A0A814ZI21_9BILA|nr:unnamed protein product [Rotaria sordida]CAF1525190.1 unnamed protein product [Rotaria sordida]
MDLSQYGNVTWPQRRVPRVIHQTYRTYDIPAIWNRPVQSVMTMNTGEFQYRRWSHADMDAFVRQREPHFYWNTFIKYRYDMQRIDSFRVIDLIVDQSLNIVKGIKYRSKKNIHSSSFDMYGDFIIDCTGRNTSSPKWLKENFNLIIPTVQVHFCCGYVTFIGERFRTDNPSLDSAALIGVAVDAPNKYIGFTTTPIRVIKQSMTIH